MGFRGVGCSVFALFVASRALADAPTPVLLDYRAHERCPSEAEFMAELTARTARARAARPGDEALSIHVRVEPIAGGSHGELILGNAKDSEASRREVSALDCRQVVTALALMTALAIDPDAVATPETPRPAPPKAEPPRPEPPPARREPPRAPPPRIVMYAGVGLEADNAISTTISPAPRVFLGVERLGKEFGYNFRLSGERAEHEQSSANGAGEFVLTSGRLEVCLWQRVIARSLWTSKCGAFEAGELRASGRSVSPVASVSRPWVAGGADLGLEFRPVPALALELGGLLMVPFVRDRFYVGQNSTVHRTPPIVLGFYAGTSVHFP